MASRHPLRIPSVGARTGSRHSRLVPAAALALSALLPSVASAQANFSEDFDGLGNFAIGQDGPAALEQAGWIFKAQSGFQHSGSPTTDWVWREGPYQQVVCGFTTFAAHDGAGYLGTDGNSVANVQGTLLVYDWAILPDVPGLTAGDVMTFWARRELAMGVQRLEVRYSPSGSIDTGSAPTDVGAFTTELLAIDTPSASSWQQFQATVPGAGRLAFRYVLNPVLSSCHQVIGIDQLTIGAATGPCAGYPTIPGPGQTVTWTAAGGPYHICQQTDIPAGSTVIVESGATVFVDANSTMEVFGHLEVQGGATIDTPFGGTVLVHGTADLVGTLSQPVIMTGGPRGTISWLPERFAAMPGAVVTMRNVDLMTTVSALGTGIVLADRVNASGDRNGFYVSGPDLFYGGNLSVRRSTFTGGAELYALGGYVLVDDLLFDDSKLEMRRPWAGQTMAIDDVVAINRPSDTAFHVGGADFWFGPGNTISGTQYPVRLEGGGLARGSVMPTSGNTFDRVLSIPAAEGKTRFSKVAIPYEIEAAPPSASIGGQITVDPGVSLLMRPGANLLSWYSSFYGPNLVLKGLPNEPIVFDQLISGVPWGIVSYASDGDEHPQVEHTIFRGADTGLVADGTHLRVESSLFENNAQGMFAKTAAVIEAHGCRLFSNTIGVSSTNSFFTPTLAFDAEGYPNWFEGNGIGLETLTPASNNDRAIDNYWGDPSGPADENNPGGLGDSTPGSNTVLPFRSTPPVANHAPVVRLLPHSRVLDEGSKVILSWEAFDDDAITGFEILFSPHGNNPGFSTLVSGIPASARSWEVVVPAAPPASNDPEVSAFRVEATDTLGQVGFDAFGVRVPQMDGFFGGFQPDPLASPQRPGQLFVVCGQWYGGAPSNASYEAFVQFDGDGQLYPLGGSFGTCGFFEQEMPPFSTDLARIMTLYTWGAGGGRISYDFSDYFEVRPSALLGDAPPTVSLTAPTGAAVLGGDLVQIQWTAGDDVALRSFEVHASYDGGRMWNTIARELPATATSFAWQLPPSTGIAECQVRVVASDSRFQNSSDTSASFPILAGPGQVGTNYCTGAPNSVGAGAVIAGTGSAVVADNTFGLVASGLPANQPGLFYYGPNTANLAFGDGVRCVGGQTVRLAPALQSSSAGTAVRDVDLSAQPMATDFLPGSTWRFQFWYRDPAAGGSGFNLTNGLEVLWQ